MANVFYVYTYVSVFRIIHVFNVDDLTSYVNMQPSAGANDIFFFFFSFFGSTSAEGSNIQTHIDSHTGILISFNSVNYRCENENC